ncbi:MAG TPA: DUF1428 domain-containing protein [bacterium]|nr:DUF1428 domain-containing protein [bacterium]
MSYVDGFVFPIRREKIDEYRLIAEKAGEIWMKHGALAYYECIGEDLTPHIMEESDPECPPPEPFPHMARAEEGETVGFSFIIYRDRADRDRINAAVMADPDMQDPNLTPERMPFDMSRMAYGGFSVLVGRGTK